MFSGRCCIEFVQIIQDLLKNVLLLLLFLIPLELTISLPFKLHITMETANEKTGYEKKKHQTNQQKQTRSGMEETGKLI